MTNQKLEILLTLKDQASRKLQKFQSMTGKATAFMKKNWLALTAGIALTILAIKKFGDVLAGAVKGLIESANKVEQLKVRLRVLLGSIEEGNKLFKNMADLASRVPKEFDEIMTSATDLTAVVRDGVKEVTELMPIIIDISAATGMGVQEVTSQVIRMYSAGAAAADMFRERGTSAALGFQAGVKYSAEETMKTLISQWEDGTGKFVGAAIALASTFDGMVSMMKDAWFMFKVDVGEEMFENIKLDLQALLTLIAESKEEGGKYSEVVEILSEKFNDLSKNTEDFVISMLVGGASVMDAWKDVHVFFILMAQTLLHVRQMANFQLFGGAGKEITEDLVRVNAELEKLMGEVGGERMEEKMQTFITAWKEALEQAKFSVMETKAELDANPLLDPETVRLWGENATETMDKVHAEVLRLGKAQEEATKKMESNAKTLAKSMESALSKPFAEMIKGTKSAKQAFRDMGNAMIDVLAAYVAETIISLTVGQVLMAIATKLSMAQASILAAAWMPAAVFAATATGGGAAVAGGTAISATMGLAAKLAAASIGAGAPASSSGGIPSSIPSFAEGGIVNRPTLAMIGEAGPEAVIPLNRGGANRIAQYVNIEINNPTIRSDDDIDALTEEISLKLAQEAERL